MNYINEWDEWMMSINDMNDLYECMNEWMNEWINEWMPMVDKF